MRPAAFYDSVADEYDAPRHEVFYRHLAEVALDLLPPALKISRIIEIGAGTGFGTEILSERYPAAAILAVEPAAAMRAHGVIHVPSAQFESTVPADHAAADLVACFVAAHWLTPAERDDLVALAEGGALVLTMPVSPGSDLEDGNLELAKLVREFRERPTWERSARRTRDFAQSLGERFDIVAVEPVDVVDTYATPEDLAASLYVRGSLGSLFGDRAAEARERLTALAWSGATIKFRWRFDRIVAHSR